MTDGGSYYAPLPDIEDDLPIIMSGPITDENILIDDNSPDWTCIYCGQQWPPYEPVSVLQAHVLECELHPASALAREHAELREAVHRVTVEHRECGKPRYDGCFSHLPLPHCRADGAPWPCDIDTIRALFQLDTTQ